MSYTFPLKSTKRAQSAIISNHKVLRWSISTLFVDLLNDSIARICVRLVQATQDLQLDRAIVYITV